MKNILQTILIVLVLMEMTGGASSFAIGIVARNRDRVILAEQRVKNNAYKKMLEAQSENDMRKLAFYRWQHDNAAQAVADLGIETVLDGRRK